MSEPWEDERGATDVDGFLAAYAEDDNTFWRMEHGHAQNVIDELIDRLAKSEAATAAAVRTEQEFSSLLAETTYQQAIKDCIAAVEALFPMPDLPQPIRGERVITALRALGGSDE